MGSRAPIVARFEEVVRAWPRAAALEDGLRTVDFATLARESAELAEELAARGLWRGEVVALAAGRSMRHVVGMLAAWRAGAAVLPIDPASPRSRVRTMLDEVRARFVLSESGVDAMHVTREATPGPSGESLAYVIYSSGSTGAPKGVLVSHRALVSVLDAQIETFRLAPADRALLVVSTAFDASISDIGTCLLAGATLVIPPVAPTPPTFATTLAAHRISHVDMPPSWLARIDPASLPDSLRTVVIGGEPADPSRVRQWAARVRVVSVYGPTEATICTHMVACSPEAWTEPQIGVPLPHVRERVQDGELWLGGDAVALGYVQRPDLERERFVLDGGERWYRTGDRVRRGAHGAWVFDGRIDRQRKVRGQLVAPEEIEAALRAHADVREATVLDDDGSGALVAAVVAGVSAERLREHLAERLPRWMLPRIVLVEGLPRGVTGKVAQPQAQELVESTRARAQVLARAFGRALGFPHVAPEDDFFALGGDSLAAIDVAALAEIDGVTIDAELVAVHRTPLALASLETEAPPTCSVLRAMGASLGGASRLDAVPGNGARGILVTGAAGFLGRRVVAELHARTDAPIVCLVRASDLPRAKARLGAAAALERVRVVVGDVTLPNLGLATDAYDELANGLACILHGAAAVNLALPYSSLAGANVRGTLEVARLAQRSGARMVLVSSLATLLATDDAGAVIVESSTVDDHVVVHGGYAQTKVVAEALVQAACARPTIVRPGLLTTDTRTAESSAACHLAMFVRTLARLGCVPSGDHASLRFDVTPVDLAARAIAAIVVDPSPPPVVHVANEASGSLADLLEALGAHRRVEALSVASFRARVREVLPRDHAIALVSAAHRLLGSHGHRGGDLFLMTGRRLDGSLAAERYGFRAPPPDRAMLDAIVSSALSGRP